MTRTLVKQWTAPTIQKFTNITFTVTSANATAGAVYYLTGGSNVGQTYTVVTTISGGTTLVANLNNSLPNASGTLTKSSGTGDTTITYSSYSISGTYTTPVGVKWIRVRMVGGGGGGGAGASYIGGGGGASGGYVDAIITSPSASYTYSLAGGGLGGVSNGSGTTGGNTTFGSALLVANGGIGGSQGANPMSSSLGGTASLGSAIGIALQGGQGSAASFGNSGTIGSGGSGGFSAFGGAGGCGFNSSTGGIASPNTGSGGGGSGNNGGANNSSGTGGSGIIIVEEYYQ